MITEKDIQQQLHTLLAADATIVTDWGNAYAIGEVDPEGVSAVDAKSLSTQVVQYRETDGTMGGTGVGRNDQTVKLGVMIYVSIDSTSLTDPAPSRELMDLTFRVRQAIMRYRSVINATSGIQYWYRIDLAPEGTLYLSNSAWRASLTMINIRTQQRRT